MSKQVTEMLKGTLEGIVLAILPDRLAYDYETTAWLRPATGQRPANRLPCATDIWDLSRPAAGTIWPAGRSCAMGFESVSWGSTRVSRQHAIKSPPPPRMADDVPAGQGHRTLARGTLMLEIDLGAVAHRAMWGMGVDPPSDTPFVHIRPISGMAECHPSAGSRPCRALSPLTCVPPYLTYRRFFGLWARSPLVLSRDLRNEDVAAS